MAASRKRRAVSERGTIEQAIAIIGLPIRTVQGMAARGEIPGAAKFGRRWTFDLVRLRNLVRDRERETCLNAKNQSRHPAAIGVASGYGVASVRPAVPREGSSSPYAQASDPAVARERFEAEKKRLIADMHFGDAPRTFDDAIVGWETWIARRVRPKAVKRYACSLGQLAPWLEGRRLPEINGRLIAEIVRDRTAAGVTNATIKRDLVAVSSVMNYAIDQGWIESNPVLDRMKRVKETRRTVVLPRPEDIALVVSRAPGMIKHPVAIAIATGAREEELLKVTRDDVDGKQARMTLVGKRGKRRTIDLNPFNGVQIIQSLPAYMGKTLLFWHSAGEDYKNFASQFRDIVRRTDDWAEASKVDFRPFRFHDLRHLHAIEWLRSGRSILELQHRLGHASIKTTEEYLKAGYLTYEQQEACNAALPGSGPAAIVSSKVTA